MIAPFEAGDKVLLIDSRGRRYLITLQGGGSFHFHRGIVEHNSIIGQEEGFFLTSSGGERVVVVRPTISEFILKMQRGAQVVYPKDAAMIVLLGDIYPGATVVEAGAGSGALTIALLRAVGAEGRVVTYELREDFAADARANVEQFLGKAENLEIRLGDVYEDIDETDFDRAVLDVPEPWRAAQSISERMRAGGILVAYLPTVLQVHELHQELVKSERWTGVSTIETLVRSWHLAERSARPDHKMVGHTGFITTARLIRSR